MEMHNHHNFEILLTSVWILYHLTCINYYIEFLNTQTKGNHCGAYNFYRALCHDSIPGGELIFCCLKPVPITEVQSKIGKAHEGKPIPFKGLHYTQHHVLGSYSVPKVGLQSSKTRFQSRVG